MTVLTEGFVGYADERGNKIIGAPHEAHATSIVFETSNCTVEFGPLVCLRNVDIRFSGTGGTVKIGGSSLFRGSIRCGQNCRIDLGCKLSVTERSYISAAEGTEIVVGDDCMFANLNVVRTDDSHPIYDLNTKERLNPSRSIYIGDHVWLGIEAAVLAGARIGSGSVVGFRSVVKGQLPSNAVCAGIPARVIRENVAWERTHVMLTPPHFFSAPVHPLADFRTDDLA